MYGQIVCFSSQKIYVFDICMEKWFASKARNDGYDLAAYNVPHFISQSIVFDDTKYNIDNLEPIANWGADPAVLIVGPDSPFNSVADLLKFAKANPGKVTFPSKKVCF